MHVRPAIEEPNLGVVATTIVVVADVHRHVHVLDAVNEEPQGEPTILDRLGLVLEGRPELVDLVDDAAVSSDRLLTTWGRTWVRPRGRRRNARVRSSEAAAVLSAQVEASAIVSVGSSNSARASLAFGVKCFLANREMTRWPRRPHAQAGDAV